MLTLTSTRPSGLKTPHLLANVGEIQCRTSPCDTAQQLRTKDSESCGLFREVTDVFICFLSFLSPSLKYCAGVGHKPFSYCEFRENWRSKNHTLLRDVNEIMFVLSIIYCSIWMMSFIRNLNVMLRRMCEFRENRQRSYFPSVACMKLH
jgi:hypothetical protein